MAANGPGYNPYRDADGKFASPEDVGKKIEGDLQEAYDTGDFAKVEQIESYAMEKMPESELGKTLLERSYGVAPKSKAAAPKRRVLNPKEQSLRERNAELAKKIVELRAEQGDVTFDDANPERSRRRLAEAVEFAESRGNTTLVNKLTSAKVLPSGAFQRKSDKQRVNTDSALKSYVAEKKIAEGRTEMERAIQSKIDSGAISEGKYTFRDDSGTYSLTVASSLDQDAFDALDEDTKKAISTPKQSLSMDLAKSKLTGEQLSAVTTKQQVMDFVVGKEPAIEGVPRPNVNFSGKNSEEVAANGLKNLSSYTQAVESRFGSKAERAAKKSQDSEIIKSAVADRGQNTFVPGRAYGNGALLSNRTVLAKKAVEETLTPAQIRSITVKSLQPDPVKAKSVLSEAQYSAIFERKTVGLRITPKKAK